MSAVGADLVSVDWSGEVLTIGLHRPAKLNALSSDLEQALLDALSGPEAAKARAVVLHGLGRAFCAGADTSELDRSPAEIATYYRGSGRVHEVLAALPQPTVAAIHGYCLGGGLELALACDLRVADTTARFGLPEVGLGILPSSGGLTRLTQMVGPALARQVVLLGERFDADQALGWGLLSAVVPGGTALDRACETAQHLAEADPHVYEWASRAIDAATEAPSSVSRLVEQLAYAALAGAR